MNVLGISCFYHDSAAALIVDGRLIAAAQEERFSRKKHDYGFPEKAIDFCLASQGINAQDLDLVVFYEKPFKKFDRILMSNISTWPHSAASFRESMIVWLMDKLWVRAFIQEKLKVKKDLIAFCSHHMSHAASCYYPSGFSNAAILTVDGVGEWATGTRGTAWDNQIVLDSQMKYPHSLGLLYSAFTAFLGFKVNDGEFKVMGMAPYGQPRFVDAIFQKIVKMRSDGSFTLNMDYFAYHYSAYLSYSEKFIELFGAPRLSAQSNVLDPHYADIAASIQKVTEIILLTQTQHLRLKTRHDNLCMAGGCCLNSCANARIFRESGFRNVYIQPAAGDDGGALGAALWGYYNVLGGTERFKMEHTYYGQEYTDSQTVDFLRTVGCAYNVLPDAHAVCNEVSQRLENGQVVGWMQGRFEWGPRALGNRSILADPRDGIMKDVVNARIKFREPFRPFAPSVLLEGVEEFFELPNPSQADLAKFMLMTVPVREDRYEYIPAVTHVDATSRIQVVSCTSNPLYYDLISAFYTRTGIPMLLNTSFNLRGEPIVNTPEEAYSTFLRSDMDALMIGNVLVCRCSSSENRKINGADLSQWSHAPFTSDSNSSANPSASIQSQAALEEAMMQGEPQTKFDVFLNVFGTVVLILLALELFVWLAIPNTNMQLKDLYVSDKFGIHLNPNFHRTIKGSEFEAEVKISENGLRELPPPPVLPDATADVKELDFGQQDKNIVVPGTGHTILALGDSFTFGCWSDIEKTWLNGIQKATGAKVINAGIPNAGTDTALEYLKSHTSQADTVMLAFYCGNDFYDNMIGKDAYTVSDGYLAMRPSCQALWKDYDCLTANIIPNNSNVIDRFPWYTRLLRRSRLYQFSSAVIYNMTGGLRPSSAEAWFLNNYTKEMQDGVKKTYALLDEINDITQDRGAAFVVVLVPSSMEVYDTNWNAWLKITGNKANLFDRTKPRQLILDWAESKGVYAFDLLPSFLNRERLYYKHDMHWNDLGHFQAGEAVSSYLNHGDVFDSVSPSEVIIEQPMRPEDDADAQGGKVDEEGNRVFEL